MSDKIFEWLHELKVSLSVAVGTTLSGLVNYFGQGSLMTTFTAIAGLILTCVLIFTHLSRNSREKKIAELDIRLRTEKLKQLKRENGVDSDENGISNN